MDSATSPFHRHAQRRLTFLACLAAVLAGCTEPEPEAPQRPPLRVGLVPWPAFDLFHLAHQERLFDSDQIELVDFSSFKELMSAFAAERIDVTCLSSNLFLPMFEEDPQVRIFMVTDLSEGGDAVVAREGIESLADLRGARVGLESSHLGHYVLERALQQVDLGPDEIERVILPEGEHVTAFLQGEVDAVVTYDPMRQRLLREGGRVLFDSSAMPAEIFDVMVTRGKVMQAHPERLRLLTASFFEARERLLSNPSQVSRRLAERSELNHEEFIDTLGGISLADAHDNHHLMSGEKPALLESLKRMAASMKETGHLEEQPSLDKAWTTEFLPPHPAE